MAEAMSSQGKHWGAAAAVLLLAPAAAIAVAWAAGSGGALAFGVPVPVVCAGLAFAIQWVAFVPAVALRTEHFYDLVGALTYLTVLGAAIALSGGAPDARAVVIATLVAVWAVRLGSFLALRVRRVGKDARFDHLKVSPPRFLTAWTLQGLWVSLTLAAALSALSAPSAPPLGATDAIGIATWLLGFGIEAVADRQKRAFKDDPANRGRFIRSGLWAWSRHPNYFGEILLWVGIAILASPTLEGWRWVSLVSPAFVFVLLVFGSGVPILEQRADERWGGEPEYEAYKARTPILVPRPPRR